MSNRTIEITQEVISNIQYICSLISANNEYVKLKLSLENEDLYLKYVDAFSTLDEIANILGDDNA